MRLPSILPAAHKKQAMKVPLPLLALAIASFGIGTTEFVIVGLLPDVASDLGVGMPRAGLLISCYALGVVVGGPVLVTALSGMARKRALLWLLAMFVAGNAACALAPSYGVLMVARIATALCHATFFGIAAVVATGLVPPEQRSRAVALVFSGLTLANVLGVPLGTALGQWAGWRASFAAIVPIGVLAAAAVARWLPTVAAEPRPRLLQELAALRRPQVMLALAASVLASAGLFSAFTFITPILEQTAGLSPHQVTLVLVLFGVGITVGNFIGGRLADWRQVPALIGIAATLTVVTAAFGFTDHAPLPATLTVIAWGATMFAFATPLQMRVVDGAAGAPNLASTLNQSAFNLGNATGASIGAAVLTAGVSYGQLPFIASALAFATLLTILAAAWQERSAGVARSRSVAGVGARKVGSGQAGSR